MPFAFELALDPLSLLALIVVAFIAGFIDAIAGGGGLLTIPALLTAGLPPHLVRCSARRSEPRLVLPLPIGCLQAG